MSYQVTQADMQILRQSNQLTYVKLELLNKQFQVIDELQGELIDGGHSEDAESDIRATSNASFIVKDASYLVNQTSKIWLDKYVRLYIGVLYQRSQEVSWYPMGVFLFNENSYTYDNTNKTLSINLLDLMCKLTGIRNGQVKGLSHTIPEGVDVRSAMISTLIEGGSSFNYIINDVAKTIPYDLEFSTGATVYEMIVALRDLYPAWETYFDDTTFICQEIPTCMDDDVILDAETIEPLIKSESLNNSFENVKNCTDVWGKCINADRYSDLSTNTGSQYNIALDTYTLSLGDLIGFKANISTISSTLKINSNTPYPIVDSEDKPVKLEFDKSYVVRYSNSKFYYQGEFQIHAIVKEFSVEPTIEFKTQDIINEGTSNIKYIINPDSPYCIDKIGEIRQVLSGADYENIYTEELCLQRAEYENWKSTRLQDSITLEMMMVPWLRVNKKIAYKSKITGKTEQYIIKNINRSLSNWTMTMGLVRFYPLYPFIVMTV